MAELSQDVVVGLGFLWVRLGQFNRPEDRAAPFTGASSPVALGLLLARGHVAGYHHRLQTTTARTGDLVRLVPPRTSVHLRQSSRAWHVSGRCDSPHRSLGDRL